MQTWSGQNPRGAVSSTRKFTTTIVLVFSLAGLIAGFAFGGLNHSRAQSPTGGTGPVKKPTPVVQSTNTVTPTATVQPIVPLDPPNAQLSAATQKADGTTPYSITIQTIDKQNKSPVHSPDITCKLWLVQRIPAGKLLDIDPTVLKAFNNLSAPIQGTIDGTTQTVSEMPNSLGFTPATPQTALCNAQGQMTWNYTVATTVPPGDYDLVYLTDWKGVHFNWSWTNITIQ